MKHFLLFALTAVIIFSCKKEQEYAAPSDPLFVELPANETGIDFQNVVTATDSFNIINYRNFYNGGGVAIGDINNDGLADIYFSNNSSKNHLYLNKGNWKFEDISEKAGVGGTQTWSTGVTMADVNADGLLDIYVCNSGNVQGGKRENELFINQGNLTFKEEAASYGLNDKGLSTHAAFFDYDMDGDLDCYVLNNSFKRVVKFDYSQDLRSVRDQNGGDKLYKNENGHFVDVSEKTGIYGSEIGFGLGISVGDVNGDKYPDIYISNDLFERDYLYINQKNGTFKEDLINQMAHVSINSMGADMGDLNNDGLADIFTTDMLPENEKRLKMNVKFDEYDVLQIKNKQSYHYQFLKNMLQINNGDGTFSEVASMAGTDATDWSWGALFMDFDNDGWKDIFVSNGMFKDINDLDYIEFLNDRENVKEIVQKKGRFDFNDIIEKSPSVPIPNYAFVNQQSLSFKNQAYELGLGKPGFSNGSAFGDLDNDGDMDLVVSNLMEKCSVFRNESNQKNGNNYLKIKLQGNTKNTFGFGTEVTIYADGNLQTLYQMPSRGFESSIEPVLNFGVGKTKKIDSLVVVWGNLQQQIIKNIPANQTLTLEQKNANGKFVQKNSSPAILFEDVTSQTISGDFLHKENLFIDFNRERLMPRLLSTEGPKIAKGDVNNDGLEDFWIAGATDDAGKIFLQTKTHQFIPTIQKDLVEDKQLEDADGIFLDTDNDKDLDLLVVSGGNQYEGSSLPMRLYLNDGKGNFKANPDGSPHAGTNAACIRACDIDNDGDQDIFVGGRSIPGNYGRKPRSFLFLNQRGSWQENTPTALQNIGMVTDATWEDFDQDGKKDLIIVGEWMPITFFKNQGDGSLNFIDFADLKNSNGWWNAIKGADIDNDGDTDFVLGNYGTNSKIKASPDKPLTMYINDFDKNEVAECLLTVYKSDGKVYPFHSRSDIVGQMPSMKKSILRYNDYAGKAIEEVFSKEQMKGAISQQVFNFETSVLINLGNGKFSLKALPAQAQVSSVYGIIVQDFDGDKKLDIFLGGNFYGQKPEIGRQDASYGQTFKGDGNGNFKYLPTQTSGLFVKGQVRDAITINDMVLVARNNEGLKIFKMKKGE